MYFWLDRRCRNVDEEAEEEEEEEDREDDDFFLGGISHWFIYYLLGVRKKKKYILRPLILHYEKNFVKKKQIDRKYKKKLLGLRVVV